MEDKKLWRYFDFIKFLALVNGEIYFARADKFKDKYEGAIPKQNFLELVKSMGYEINDLDKNEVKQEFNNLFNEKKKKVALSCWHLNESESAAMWEIYSRAGLGIAISTTKSNLSKIEKPEGFDLEMFEVNYFDFDMEYRKEYLHYELLPFKSKRKEFEYEQEFRIMLFQYSQHQEPGSHSRLNDIPPEGIKVNINPAELIVDIIAAPYMKEYEVTEIQRILDIVNKEKGTDYAIQHSKLYENLRY